MYINKNATVSSEIYLCKCDHIVLIFVSLKKTKQYVLWIFPVGASLLTAACSFRVRLWRSLFNHSSIEGHLACFQFFAITNNALISYPHALLFMLLEECFFSQWIMSRRIARLKGMYF